MENLIKIVKKLSKKEFTNLLEEVSGGKDNHPRYVLEYIRVSKFDEEVLIQKLEIDHGAYYTMKSRLMNKVAVVLANKNTYAIKEKVANVGSSIFNEDKKITIKYLKDLEKQLISFDLSNELIVVYKALARHHIYDPDEYDKYEKLYNKHVAHSLAMEKAEDLLLKFIRDVGEYRLTGDPVDKEMIHRQRREMYNITEMFPSHRLFVLNNIINIYYHCMFDTVEELKTKEKEVDETLREFEDIFNKYDLDAFYHNRKPLIDFMYVLYYYRIGEISHGNVYYKSVVSAMPYIVGKHAFTFYIIMLLKAKLEKYFIDENVRELIDLNPILNKNFEIDKLEIYHQVAYGLFRANTAIIVGNYQGAEQIIKGMKSKLPLRLYINGDVECKAMLCLLYSLLGDEEKCKKNMASLSRRLDLDKPEYENISLFLKFLKVISKHGDLDRRLRISQEIFGDFVRSNVGPHQILRYIKITEEMTHQIANHGSNKSSHPTKK